MSLKIKVSKKVKKQCDDVKLQIEIMDETKQPIKCDVSYSCETQALSCFWDRHKINGLIIRCPLKYKPKQVVKIYRSDVSKEEYTIKENITKSHADTLVNSEIKGGLQILDDNFEVSDAFCSFNCCLAWIKDNKHDRRYDQSEMLLHKINGNNLNPAPHWRTLIAYGGNLTIEEFRQNFQKNEYQYNGTVLDTGFLFSQKLRF